jgi:hypothetical protein
MSFWVYGLVYVAFEVVGHQLESVGWQYLTALDIAQAITDAVLFVVVVVAVLVAGQLGMERWRRSMAAWSARQAALEPPAADPEPILVTSWRPQTLAITAGAMWTPRYPAPEGPLDGGAPYR